MNTEETIKSLTTFRSEPKFTCIEPEFTMLNPSPDSVTFQAKSAINDCIDALINGIESGAEYRVKRHLIKLFLSKVEKSELDTEDREYVAFYFHKLGRLININVSFDVNKWLYGTLIAVFSKLTSKG